MKRNFNPRFLYINTLFKTIEYKIDLNNYLHISELSLSGNNKKRKISLDTITSTTTNTESKKLTWLLLTLLSTTIITALYLTLKDDFSANIASTLFILSGFLLAFFIAKNPTGKFIYTDSFSNKHLFTLRKNHETEIDEFVTLLNKNINNVHNDAVLSKKHRIDYSKEQRVINNTHLDALFNSGVLDEVTYKRISKNINKFNIENKDLRPLADVIYLSSNRL